MGKRELLLILGIAIVGVVAYQLTAPAAETSDGGFSVARILEHLRAEFGGPGVRAERQVNLLEAIDPQVEEIQISDTYGRLRVLGEDRTDVAAEANVELSGHDQADADRRVARVALLLSNTGRGVALVVKLPPSRRRPRVDLTLRVPRRLTVRFTLITGSSEIQDVAAVVMDSRGDAVLANIAGLVEGEHRGGDLRIDGAGGVKLQARRSDLRLAHVEGEATIDAIEGSVEASGLAGPIRIEARRCDIDLADVTGPVEMIQSEGNLRIRGARTRLQIEGRRSDVTVALAGPAPLEITSLEGDVVLDVASTVGITLDATATSGEIRLSGFEIAVTQEDEERHLRGPIGGGGPTATIRATRGDITINKAGVGGQ